MPKSDFSKVKLLIIDLDNTLCDTFHTLSLHQWEKAARALEKDGRVRQADALRGEFGKASFSLEQLKMPMEERRIAIKAYDAVRVKTLTLFPDAKAIMSHPLPKVLVTRGERKLQDEKVAHLKLQKYFKEIYLVPTFKSKKDAFKAILKRHNLKPGEALVIGDRVEEEIKDANQLRMPSCLVRRPMWPTHKGVAKPTITVRSLRAIAKLLPR